MTDHRVRLDDEELQLVVSSLRARAAGLGFQRKLHVLRLADRLDIGQPGNPNWHLYGSGEPPDCDCRTDRGVFCRKCQPERFTCS
jgi:hypothetical protein